MTPYVVRLGVDVWRPVEDLEQPPVSRGPGRMMRAVCDVLRAAGGPLTFMEVASAVYGTRTVNRYRRGHRRSNTRPAGDASNLRRAIDGLIERGTVVQIGGHRALEAARFGREGRYALNDRCTSNNRESAVLPRSETPPAVLATPVMLGGVPANDVAGVTTHCIPPAADESTSGSTRPTSAGVTAAFVRGALPVPARVFPWERALLSGLVGDLLENLSHAANKNDDSDS